MNLQSVIKRIQNDNQNIYEIACEWSNETGDKPLDVIRLIGALLRRSCNCPFIDDQGARLDAANSPQPFPDNKQTCVDYMETEELMEYQQAVASQSIDASSVANKLEFTPIGGIRTNSAINRYRTDISNGISEQGCTINTLEAIGAGKCDIETAMTIHLSRRNLITLLEHERIPVPDFLHSKVSAHFNTLTDSISVHGEAQTRDISHSNTKMARKDRRKSDLTISRFPLVKGFRWEEVDITFISNDAVRIHIHEVSRILHFAEMGFKDGRIGDVPDTRWAILREFAQRDGEIAWGDINQDNSAKLKAAVKDIRKRLKMMFDTEDDPFYPYRAVKAYKTKFKLRDVTIS